ncbi:MAG TPA: phosphoglycerate dehydrogenase [Bryobacteraceae bacterium]|nr:phosphoglycerate dehydrogenase [Bryobacteraceae bacterium]
MKVLVAEPMAAAGLELLRSQSGWEVIASNPKEYAAHLADSDALIVRSAVKVTKQVLEQAPKLRAIGRAGVGVDNVDIPAATAAGVLVMNTPGGNAVSVAEHTLALMLAMARAIPQASASTKSGKWEKKKFMGSELRGKTLGVIGLGSIGREVARRARAFEMKVVASDPYVSPRVVEDASVDMVGLDTLYGVSDYIALHMALTPETRNMISAEAFAKMKQGVRLVNCARGELIDAEALRAAIESGKVAGAALDVFDKEPPAPDYPLFALDPVLATPHIAGSTEEAQEIVGVRIAEQLVEYLQSGIAINAVNMPALAPEQYKVIEPYISLAERLGTFAAQIASGSPTLVKLVYLRKLAEDNTHLIRNAGLAGILNQWLSQKANLVNAMQIAAERSLSVVELHQVRAGHMDAIRLELETDSGLTAVEGAVVLGKPRLLQVDGIYCEAPLAGHLTYMRNQDVPGVIGHVGTVLGRNRINIANFSLGRHEAPPKPGVPLEAVAVVETDERLTEAVLAQLRENPAVKLARAVEFSA